MTGAFVKTPVALLLCLFAADLISIFACFLLDVVPLRTSNPPLPYAIWAVLGAFAGFVAFGIAGAWAGGRGWRDGPAARPLANRVAAAGALTLLALGALFYWLHWSRGGFANEFIPDSAPHTLAFLGAASLALLAARTTVPARLPLAAG